MSQITEIDAKFKFESRNLSSSKEGLLQKKTAHLSQDHDATKENIR